jgi:hypothetical protein
MRRSHLTLRLPTDLARSLESAADDRGVAKSLLVREAVSSYLGRDASTFRPPLLARDLAAAWGSLPALAESEREDFASDIERARWSLPPLPDPWA